MVKENKMSKKTLYTVCVRVSLKKLLLNNQIKHKKIKEAAEILFNLAQEQDDFDLASDYAKCWLVMNAAANSKAFLQKYVNSIKTDCQNIITFTFRFHDIDSVSKFCGRINNIREELTSNS